MIYYNYFVVLLAVLLLNNYLIAQPTKALLQIDTKTIEFQLEEKIRVWRTVTDTLIRCKNANADTILITEVNKSLLLNPKEEKIMVREEYTYNDCVWSRLTNDVLEDPYGEGLIVHHIKWLNDSLRYLVRPDCCHRYDTVMQISPITLEEEFFIVADSAVYAKYDIGGIKRKSFKNSLKRQFNITSKCPDLKIDYISLWAFKTSCDYINVYYTNGMPNKEALSYIDKCPKGTFFAIQELAFLPYLGKKIRTANDVATLILID